MKARRKIWLGVGAVVVAGSGVVSTTQANDMAAGLGPKPPSGFMTGTTIPPAPAGGFVLAQHVEHGTPAAPAAQGGEGGEGDAIAKLPPQLAFAVRIALVRGHLG